MTNPIAPKWILSLSTIKWLAFALACEVMYFRQPAFFSSPRFWAEEGAVYYKYALLKPWYQVLLTSHPKFGYYSLFNNLTSLIASRLVPLEYAPLVTTLLAYGIQSIPLAIILWGDSELYSGYEKKLIAVLIVLFTLSSREVWLNTTNSHFYLLLITVLILLERLDNASHFRTWSFRLLLIIAGLTGPTSCFIAPLFFFKTMVEKKREYLIQTALLFIATSVQLVVFLLNGSTTPLTASRFSQVSIGTFGFIAWSRTIIVPIAGVDIAVGFASKVLALNSEHPKVFELVGICLLMGLMALLTLNFLSKHAMQYDKSILIAGSYASILFLSIVTSLTQGNKLVLIDAEWSPRYFYVPSVLLFLLVLSWVRFGERGWFAKARNFLCCTLLMVSLGSGIKDYEHLNWQANWPDWRQEVNRYYSDSTYNELQIWPPGWSIKLESP